MESNNAHKKQKTENGSIVTRHGYFNKNPRHPQASLSLPPLPAPPPLLSPGSQTATNNNRSSVPLPYPPDFFNNNKKERKKKSNGQKVLDLKNRIVRELLYPKLCDMIYIDPDLKHWYCTMCRAAGIKACGLVVCNQCSTSRVVQHCNTDHHEKRLDPERRRLNALRVGAEDSKAKSEWLRNVQQTKTETSQPMTKKTQQRMISNDYNKALAIKHEQNESFNHLQAEIANKNAEIHRLMKQNQKLLDLLNQRTDRSNANEVEHSFKDWLSNTVKLPQYVDNFVEDGFDDMETITETMDEEDLRKMGVIKPGHRKKIMLFVKRLKY